MAKTRAVMILRRYFGTKTKCAWRLKTTCRPARKSLACGTGQAILRVVLTRKAFRYRVYPTPEQEARLLAWESALRFLWNLANEQRRMAYDRPKCWRRYPTAFDQINELTPLRAALP